MLLTCAHHACCPRRLSAVVTARWTRQASPVLVRSLTTLSQTGKTAPGKDVRTARPPENCVGRVDRDARQGAGLDPLRAGGPRLTGSVHDWMLRPAVPGAFGHRTGRHARDLTALGTGPRAAIERVEATAKARNVSHRRYLPFSAPAAMRRAGDGSGTGFAGCAAGMAAHEGSRRHTGCSTRRHGAATGLDGHRQPAAPATAWPRTRR
jgi:hypothetical protein